MPETIHKPSTPYVGPVHCALHDGMKIKVSVKVLRDQNRFAINLQCGPSKNPRSDIAFHFNPRFEQSQVVRNSLINGAWGSEEKDGKFPFHKGFSCEIVILVKSNQYQVSVDSRHVCDFVHRIPIDRVSHIAVEQGVEIKRITYEPERSRNKSSIHHHHHNDTGFGIHHHDIDLDRHPHGIDLDTQHHGIDLDRHPHGIDLDMQHHGIDTHASVMGDMMSSFGQMFGKMHTNAMKMAISQPEPPAGMVCPGQSRQIPNPSKTYPNKPSPAGSVGYPSPSPYPSNAPPAGSHIGNNPYPGNQAPVGNIGSIGNPASSPFPSNPVPAGSYPGTDPYPSTAPPAGSYPGNNPYPGNALPTGNYPGNNPYPGNALPTGNYPGNNPYPGNALSTGNYLGNNPYPGNALPAGSFPGNNSGYPSKSYSETSVPPGAPYPGSTAGPISNPPVPFQLHLGSLHPGKMVFVSGVVHPNPSRFNVNFLRVANDDIAFTFDVRFNFGTDRQVLVRNTKQGASWGPEERDKAFFPFKPNVAFDLLVLVEQHCFKVAVNNQHLLEYKHRIQPLTCVDTLKIDGDLTLTQVRLQ